MPIYEYRCASCGHELEALQKLSDAPLTECPACHKPDLRKLVSAAGFQLKGSGWYVTDFRNSGGKPPATGAAAGKPAGKAADAGASAGATGGGSDTSSGAPSTDSKSGDSKTSSGSASTTGTTPSATPGGSGS